MAADGSSAMQVRCSYADALGGVPQHLQGKVLARNPRSVLPDPMSDTKVSVFRLDGSAPDRLGQPVVQARTDAQGGFSLHIVLKPGRYLVVAGDRDHVLAAKEIVVEARTKLGESLMLVVPVDPALQ